MMAIGEFLMVGEKTMLMGNIQGRNWGQNFLTTNQTGMFRKLFRFASENSIIEII